jgi:hypothetical protein
VKRFARVLSSTWEQQKKKKKKKKKEEEEDNPSYCPNEAVNVIAARF